MSSSQSDGLSVIKSSSSEYSAPTLLTIPGELRNRIYELSLLQDTKVYPFDYKPCGCDCPKHKRHAPAVALLRVNRQINHEATPLLYGHVTVHLSTGYIFMKFMAPREVCMYGSPAESQIYPSRHLIRSLRIEFVPEHMPSEVRSGHVQDCWADPNFRLLSKRKRTQEIHRYNRDVCQTVWMNAGKVINLMRALKSLTIDFDQVFCPLGCCRMVGHVLKSLGALRKKKAFTMKISGVLQGEKKMVLGWLKSSDQAVDDGVVIESFEDREEEEEEEEEGEEEEEEDDDGEDDEDDNDEEEGYGDEDDEPLDEEDGAGISGASTAGSHSGDSEDSLETSDTDGTEFPESPSAFRKERLEI